MAIGSHPRMMLLNRLESRTASQAPAEHTPPPHAGIELFQVLKARVKNGQALEFVGNGSMGEDDGAGHDLLQICAIEIQEVGDHAYAAILIQYVDSTQSAFPVVDTATLEGRELTGNETERAARAAHMVAKFPSSGATFDDGHYQCVIEHVDGIRRRDIETLFRRQLRAHAKEHDYTFQVTVPGKRKAKVLNYKYYPKFTLSADVGRSFGTGISIESLSTLLFTKRAEKQMTGGEVSVIHDDVVGDVEIRISAAQAPRDKK
mgnify:CR=1 FL=1